MSKKELLTKVKVLENKVSQLSVLLGYRWESRAVKRRGFFYGDLPYAELEYYWDGLPLEDRIARKAQSCVDLRVNQLKAPVKNKVGRPKKHE